MGCLDCICPEELVLLASTVAIAISKEVDIIEAATLRSIFYNSWRQLVFNCGSKIIK